MDFPDIVDQQCGVVTRRQLVEAGWSVVEVRRAVRRRELVRIHEGVFVSHTGPLSWLERAWAAVLDCEPAALSGGSALRLARRSGLAQRDPSAIELVVAADRRLAARDGVVLRRARLIDERVQWGLLPPRERIEHAVLTIASEAYDDMAIVAVLADVCGARLTNPTRLAAALRTRRRLPHRRWMAEVIADLEAGTNSVLEHGYLRHVERAHGLPTGQRQAAGPGRTWQDVHYDLGMVVELDGRAHHSTVQDRSRDLDRDLAVAVDRNEMTIRVGYAQVFATGCRTAVQLGTILQRLGWSGSPTRCQLCGVGGQPG